MSNREEKKGPKYDKIAEGKRENKEECDLQSVRERFAIIFEPSVDG